MQDKSGIIDSASEVASLIADDLVLEDGEAAKEIKKMVADKWTLILNHIFKHISEKAIVTGFYEETKPITKTQIS